MARPRKLTLDFFLHDAGARTDRKVRAIRRKHGNDGYATYFCILEMLCAEDGLRLSLSNQLDVETAIEECGLRDDAHLYKIIETATSIGLFDSQLWHSERVIFSHGLFKRYKSRLEERKKDAERKQRKREVESLQARIDEMTASDLNPDPDPNTNTDPNTDPKQSRHIRPDNDGFRPDNEVVRPDNSAIADRIEEGQKPATERKSKRKSSESSFDIFKDKFNQEKPNNWATILVMNDRRKKIVDSLIKELGGAETAIAVFESALTYARSDSWCLQHSLNLENFASNGKIVQFHERQMAKESSYQKPVASAPDDRTRDRWLQEAREKGTGFYTLADGSFDQTKIKFWRENREEILGESYV